MMDTTKEEHYNFICTVERMPPGESRNHFFSHFLEDLKIIEKIIHCGLPSIHSLENGPQDADCSSPPMSLPLSSSASVRKGLMENFFKKYMALTVYIDEDRSNLSTLIYEDFLGCGVIAGEVQLPALHLRYPYSRRTCFHRWEENIIASLAHIFSPAFKTQNEFKLTITLEMVLYQGWIGFEQEAASTFIKTISYFVEKAKFPVDLFLVFEANNHPEEVFPPLDITSDLTSLNADQLRRKIGRYAKRITQDMCKTAIFKDIHRNPWAKEVTHTCGRLRRIATEAQYDLTKLEDSLPRNSKACRDARKIDFAPSMPKA